MSDPFAARARLETGDGPVELYRLAAVAELERLPHTVKILLENLLRRAGTRDVSEDDVRALASWPQGPRRPTSRSCRPGS